MATITIGHNPTARAKRLSLAIAISVASLGLIAVAFATVLKPKPAQPIDAGTKKQTGASSPVWNVALGNVVVLAPELGFKVTAPGENEIEPGRVAAKLETQLASLRQLYRQQSESDPALLGGLTLQLLLGNAGDVERVKVLSTQLKNKKFSKAVAAEAGKWKFMGIAPAGTLIESPLLFVREGMDITTLMNWEKTLRGPREERAETTR